MCSCSSVAPCFSCSVLSGQFRLYQASVLYVLFYGSERCLISTSLCSRLSAFDRQAQWSIYHQNQMVRLQKIMEARSHTTCQPIQRYIAYSHLRWCGLRPIILPTPSTHSTRARRHGQDPVRLLARDGATSSPNISRSWGQNCCRRVTSLSIEAAGGSTLLLLWSPCSCGNSLGKVGLMVIACKSLLMIPIFL